MPGVATVKLLSAINGGKIKYLSECTPESLNLTLSLSLKRRWNYLQSEIDKGI